VKDEIGTVGNNWQKYLLEHPLLVNDDHDTTVGSDTHEFAYKRYFSAGLLCGR
jgi:hypothetical protein